MVDRAVVVGIPHTEVPGFPDLPADEDACRVAQFLSRRGFDVDSRINGCSVEQFTTALTDLHNVTYREDLALVYFSLDPPKFMVRWPGRDTRMPL